MDLSTSVADVWREHGIKSAWVIPLRFAEYYYYKWWKKQSFTMGGTRYHHFYHLYNTTYRKERAIEVAIAVDFLAGLRGKRVLEVGNVLSHYGSFHHDVVDKYEQGDGVINEDIVDYRPSKLYDGILSVSTLEHVGWDEIPKDSKKIGLALKNMMGLLAPQGTMLVTVPLGHNPHLDEMVTGDRLNADEVFYLKRVSADNGWEDVKLAVVVGSQYGHPYQNANALCVAYWRRPSVKTSSR
jgi:hypothetical protein